MDQLNLKSGLCYTIPDGIGFAYIALFLEVIQFKRQRNVIGWIHHLSGI